MFFVNKSKIYSDIAMWQNNLLWNFNAFGGVTPAISADPDGFDFYFGYTSEDVAVSATHSWEVASNPSWISVTPSSGSGSRNVTISMNTQPLQPQFGTVTLRLVNYPSVTANIYVNWAPSL